MTKPFAWFGCLVLFGGALLVHPSKSPSQATPYSPGALVAPATMGSFAPERAASTPSPGGAFHHADAVVASRAPARAPKVAVFRTGHPAAEPTLGFTKDGTLYFQVYDGRTWPAVPTYVLRSSDAGATWEVATDLTERHAHHTLDPYLFADSTTSRVFTTDWLAPCHRLSYSDDGSTWQTTVMGCPISDHQTMYAGPPVTSKTDGYPNVVYFCGPGDPRFPEVNVASLETICMKSLNGGADWVRTGEPAFPGEDCAGGGTGHLFVDDKGALYLGKADYCGRPTLAISRDEGATWTRVQVADMEASWHEGAVAADGDGNVYYLWTSNAQDRLPYLAISRDAGATWARPLMVGKPGVNESSLPAVVAREGGAVAIAYMGTETSPGAPFTGDYVSTTWNGYLAVTSGALGRRPVFYTVSVNAPGDPLIKGRCAQSRCGVAFDFLDLVIGPDGAPWAAMVDGCFEDSCIDDPGPGALVGTKLRPGEGIVATLRGAKGF